MSMKPCPHEQDVLFVIHGMATTWQRCQVALHIFTCESCRRRRQEFVATSRALSALRPGFASPGLSVAIPPRRRTRLILCSAAVAIAAAALSYYFAFVDGQPRVVLESEPRAAAALPPPDRCEGGVGVPIPEEKKKLMKLHLKGSKAAVPAQR